MVFERQIAGKEVISLKSELDLKSSCIHVAFNLNGENLEFRVFGFQTAKGTPLCLFLGGKEEE